MNKLDMESINIVDGNIEKIGNLFPNVIVETENGKSIDFDLLKQELSKEIVEGNKEKYQLTWPGKKEAILTANTPSKNTLRPLRDKSVDFDNTQNIYIEGDNLEALKILQESYLNKVKCIYIDPPYNTGNDFIYNDNFKKGGNEELVESGQVDEYGNRLVSNNQSNGRFHSDWLSMMYPRLKLARNLLKEDGIIFISIDEKEYTNLKKVCEEIYGEANFIASLKWKKKKQPSFLARVAVIMEYILVFAKDSSKITKLSVETLSDSDKPIVNSSNKLTKLHFKKGIRCKANDFMIIKSGVYQNKSMSIEFLNDVIVENGRTTNDFDAISKYRLSQEQLDKFVNGDLVFITKNLGFRRDLSEQEKGKGKSITDLLLDWGQNQDGSNDLKKIFEISDDENIFSNPKPPLLIKNLIKTICGTEDIILDFFSGSATTADSIMQYNAEKNINAKFIMIQLPELTDKSSKAYKRGYKTICDIGEERIRRAAKKIKEETNADIDYGFRVYKIDSSNMKDVYYKPSDLEQAQLKLFESNIKEDRTTDDLLTQVILDLGLTLDLKIEEKQILNNKVYFVDDNSLVACFDDDLDINIVDEICKYRPLKVVFKDNSFKYDNDKINLEKKIKKLSPETEINIL